MHILPTISTMFIVISAIFVGFGWYHIVKGNRDTHEKLMVLGAIFALAFFIIYMSRTLFEGNTAFGGPESLKAALSFILVLPYYAGNGGGRTRSHHIMVCLQKEIS